MCRKQRSQQAIVYWVAEKNFSGGRREEEHAAVCGLVSDICWIICNGCMFCLKLLSSQSVPFLLEHCCLCGRQLGEEGNGQYVPQYVTWGVCV